MRPRLLVDNAPLRLRAHGCGRLGVLPAHSAVSLLTSVAIYLRSHPLPQTHHDLLREEELVDFAALLPRPDDEPVDDFFAAERDRLGDDSLDDDFFAAERDRLGDDSLDDDFFAAERDRLGDDSLEDDFFAAGRGRLDVAAVGADFLAELLAAGADSDGRSEP